MIYPHINNPKCAHRIASKCCCNVASEEWHYVLYLYNYVANARHAVISKWDSQ